MPYALIPEGFTLKKVTKAQEEALKDHRKHDDFKAFLSSGGGGLTMGIIPLLGIGLIFLIPIILLMMRKAKDGTMTAYLQENPTFWGTYARGMAGIPETLQNVILPQPVREEIEGLTGLDLDVGKQFNKLFELEAELRKRQAEE